MFARDAAGNPLAASAVGNPFTYTGQRHDWAVGLHHFKYRSYSPRLGRWMQRDPAGYVDGVSLYEYVGGQPTSAVDPLGLFDKACFRDDFAIGVVGGLLALGVGALCPPLGVLVGAATTAYINAATPEEKALIWEGFKPYKLPDGTLLIPPGLEGPFAIIPPIPTPAPEPPRPEPPPYGSPGSPLPWSGDGSGYIPPDWGPMGPFR